MKGGKEKRMYYSFVKHTRKKRTSHMKNTSFVTKMGVTKKRTLNGSKKSGICKMGSPRLTSTEVTEAETLEAILFTSNIGHECSLIHKSS